MCKKFIFCIIDDQNLKAEAGCKRAFDNFLIPKRYMQKEVDIEGIDQNNNSINYKIISSETNYNFDTAVEFLKDKSSNFDAFFIDIKMDDSAFKSEILVDEDIKYLPPGKISKQLAGLYFINLLNRNDSPKFFFSAATDVQDIMKYFNLVQGRLDDLFFKDIDKDLEKMEAILDSCLIKTQLRVINIQDSSMLAKLKERLKRKEDFDISDIRDYKEKDKFWSMRTLFPKQINILLSKQPQNRRDQAKQDIYDILETDWRKLMLNGFLTHPFAWLNIDINKINEEDVKKIEDEKNKVSTLEFQTPLDKTSSFYVPLTALPDYKNLTDDLRDNIIFSQKNKYSVNQYLPLKENTSLLKYFKTICQQYKTIADVKVTEEIKIWCHKYGIYPRDIAYISHIAYHNGMRHLKRYPVDMSVERKTLAENEIIKFHWKYDVVKKENNHDTIFNNLLRANKNPTELLDSGLTDICKIVCYRYKGIFIFSSGSYVFIADRRQPSYNNSAVRLIWEQTENVIKFILFEVNNSVRIDNIDYAINSGETNYFVIISKP